MPNIRLLADAVLVKPIRARYDGCVIIPDTAEGQSAFESGDPSQAFEAEVVATGPGDKLLHGRCVCGATATVRPFARMGGMNHSEGRSFGRCKCGRNEWTITRESRAPMELTVGDRVIIPRRPNSAAGGKPVTIEGEDYLLMYEEQSALMKIEDAVAA